MNFWRPLAPIPSVVSLTPGRAKAKRVTDPDEVIHRGRGQAQPNMQIELMMGLWLLGRPEMH